MSAAAKPPTLHQAVRGDHALGGVAGPPPGVHSRLVASAARRVARRLDPGKAHHDSESAGTLLAVIALAVDGRRPDFLSLVPPHCPPQLGRRLVDMLRTELLRSRAKGLSPARPSAVLHALTRLEQVRLALEENLGQPLGEALTGALDPLVEVVHDLRSPLTSILFLAETLQRGQSGPVNSLQQRQLGLIYSAALGLASMVSDVLDLARGGDELVDGEPSPLSLSELLESVAEIVRPMAEEKGLRIDLTPIQPDRRLGHLVPLTHVLLNLTINALKFTERGGVGISCAARGPTGVEIAVRDTGPGINPRAMASLYQPFRHARGRSGYCFSGTGLGLGITRKLVGALGSKLRLRTGRWGTRFSFELELPPLLPR